jgi:hypothetical protein
LIGVATHKTVASSTSTVVPADIGMSMNRR